MSGQHFFRCQEEHIEFLPFSNFGTINDDLNKRWESSGITTESVGLPPVIEHIDKKKVKFRQTDGILFVKTQGGDNIIVILEVKASQQSGDTFYYGSRSLLIQHKQIKPIKDYYEGKGVKVITVGLMYGLGQGQGNLPVDKMSKTWQNLRALLTNKWDFLLRL